jgi:cell wall-associated NlpC family hydrolase
MLSTAERAAAVAVQQVGVPYRYGGSTPAGFDCSGLVHYSFARAGASVPRTTRQLWSASQHVDPRQLREGDLLFFRFDNKIAHVGLYLGNGRFVHAPSSGKQVSVQSLRSDVYRDAFVRGGRL